jgi:20S proteasome alpha/beta subunit
VTTIAYRDGVLASDSLVTSDGLVVGSAEKIISFGPLLAGAAGTLSFANAFFDWLKAGAKGSPPKMGEGESGATGIVVMPDGLIVTFDDSGCDRIRAEYHAIGSGRRLAMGAMAAGACAAKAVRAACELDVYSGGKVVTLQRQPARV